MFLANAPGNGVADDKAVYCYVPELIDFYLGERPLLESVPTYRTDDETERLTVLERVGELVTKPVDGAGGAGVLIGPDATARQVADRREEIVHDPSRWIAQEVVSPVVAPGPRRPHARAARVDLRVFTCGVGSGDDVSYEVLPVALTRVAAKGSMVVNSSQGGGAKDTWIIERRPRRGAAGTRRGRRPMCGLAGELRFDGEVADLSAVERMTDCQSPRGPDGRGVVEPGPGGTRPPEAEDHRPDVHRVAADGRLEPRTQHRVQRLHLQLPRPAQRAHPARTRVLLGVRHRGGRQVVRRVGTALRRPLPRHVRLRHRRARERSSGAGQGPARDQAPLRRRVDALGCGSPRRCPPWSPVVAPTPRSIARRWPTT